MELADLTKLRCPQNWDFDNFNDIEEKLLKNYKSEEIEESTQYASQCKMYLLFVQLSYETYRKGQYDNALKYLDKSEYITDDFIKLYENVFKHVFLASKAHVLFKMNSFKKAEEILNELKDQSFNEKEEAGFKYIRSCILGRYAAMDPAIEMIESALKIVPDEAEFNFMLGITLGKKRHMMFPSPQPSQKEFDACRKAVSLRRSIPHYSVTLAKSYMDIGFKLPTQKRKEYKNLAASLYRGLLQYHESLTGNDIARCVFNLMKIDFKSDLEIYCEIARKKSDSVLVNHYIGSYYLRDKQFEEALECFKKTASTLPFICSLILLLMYRINNNSLIDEDIESYVTELENTYKSMPDLSLQIFYLGVSEFYFMIKKDYNMACKYFLSASKLDITEPRYCNLLKVPMINYFFLLKTELLAYPFKNDFIKNAITVLKELPSEVTASKNSVTQSKSVFEILEMLKC